MKIIQTPNAPAAIGPYSQAVLAGETLYISGQIGFDPATMTLVAGGVEAETRQVLANLKAVLEAADLGVDRLIKCSIFLADMEDFTRVNAIYADFVSDPPPARETVEVSGLPKGVRVEISAIAWAGP